MNIFTEIQQSGLSTWIRESPSLFAYPTFLFLHTVGLGLLVGPSMAIDLRILGFGRATALIPMNKFFRVIAVGFWISLISGSALWIADAETWSKDLVFYIKMGFIVFGMLHLQLIRRRIFSNPDVDENNLPTFGKMLAVGSLVVWVGAITAGRLTAYIGK